MGEEYYIQQLSQKEFESCFYGYDGSVITSEECSRIFDSVIKNMQIYNHLYKDKVYKIDTTLANKGYFITIGKAKLLHLLGFDFYGWQKKYKPIMEAGINNSDFSRILEEDYIQACKDDSGILYEVLDIITDKHTKEMLCEKIPSDPVLASAFNMKKIKTKNFAFERLGLLQRASGIVIYDRNLDVTRGKGGPKSDLFLLKDIGYPIFPSEVNWIFNGYAHQIEVKRKKRGKKDMNLLAKNAETLLIEKDSSSKFDNQQVSLINQLAAVTTSLGSMHTSDFQFMIEEYDEDAVGDFFPQEVIFTEEEIDDMVNKMQTSFPLLDYSKINNYKINQGMQRRR